MKLLQVVALALALLYALQTEAQAPASQGSADWKKRSSDSNVVRAWKFSPGQDLAAYINPDGNATPKFDPAVGGLKFVIPAKGGSGAAGYFEMNYTPNTKRAYGGGGAAERATLPVDYYPQQFGLGDTYYVQWRQRFSPEFLFNSYAGTAWKQIIVGAGDVGGFRGHANSCTDVDLVVANYVTAAERARGTQAPKQGGFPILYQACGYYEGLFESVGKPVTDFTLQNQMPGCVYSLRNNPKGYSPPCFGYAPDEWMTFQLGITLGTEWWLDPKKPRPTSARVRFWIAREGQPQRLVHDVQNYGFHNAGNPPSKHGKLWLLPYMTNRDPAAAAVPEAYTWYDEIIVSRAFIPDPS